ncbi:MAG TPA: XdhC family protein [Povalibacter sp.]|nr:XdhC family protein [Povalibacter sp.]
MNHRPVSLAEFFRDYRRRGEPLVLATVAQTIGSTYRKAGAQMLIAHDGNAAGLLSGGCLEADLVERARTVLDTGQALTVEYDTRSSDDILWGIGLGCEGAMRILMTRLDAGNQYQPFAYTEQCREAYVAARIALVTASDNPRYALGSAYGLKDDQRPPPAIFDALVSSKLHSASAIESDGASFLIVPIELPTRLLLLGAGPDAMPLVEIAGLMGWQVTVLDHRPAYAVTDRFPRAREVKVHPANALPEVLARTHYDAAVVMSHHLTSDQLYLAALADSHIPYVGLLGPAPRRARLMSEIGAKAEQLGERLRGPIGLDIGARTPETIALAIVSEIQAVLAGRAGGSFSAGDFSAPATRVLQA